MPPFPDALQAEMLFDAHITLAPPEAVGATPFGQRSVFSVTGGTFAGPRLRGTVLPGGGDWFLGLPNGAGELDVRVTFKTDDGALLYLAYHGILDVTPDVAGRVLGGEDVSLAEYYFRTAPRFETGHEAYAWLNKIICVGVGYFGAGKVGYRVFAVK